MQFHPLRRVTAQFILTALLLEATPVVAQTTSATDGNPAATHASCKTSLAVGRCHEALPICQAGLRETERRLGLEYEDVASWLLLVSRALQELGQYAQAEPISQRWS